MRKVLAASLAALSLAACGLGGGGPPPRKPGLWQQTIQSDRRPEPFQALFCFDAASDKRAPALGRRGGRMMKCDKYQLTHAQDGSYVVDSTCQTPEGATITSHSVATGDFSTSYTIVSQRTVQGSEDPAHDGAFKTTLTAVYKGDCPAELQPGQMELPDGTITAIGRGGFGGGGGGGGAGGGAGGNQAVGNQAAPAANSAGQ